MLYDDTEPDTISHAPITESVIAYRSLGPPQTEETDSQSVERARTTRNSHECHRLGLVNR